MLLLLPSPRLQKWAAGSRAFPALLPRPRPPLLRAPRPTSVDGLEATSVLLPCAAEGRVSQLLRSCPAAVRLLTAPMEEAPFFHVPTVEVHAYRRPVAPCVLLLRRLLLVALPRCFPRPAAVVGTSRPHQRRGATATVFVRLAVTRRGFQRPVAVTP